MILFLNFSGLNFHVQLAVRVCASYNAINYFPHKALAPFQRLEDLVPWAEKITLTKQKWPRVGGGWGG